MVRWHEHQLIEPFLRAGIELGQIGETEGSREGYANPVRGDVGIGMRGVAGDLMLNQVQQNAALGVRAVDAVHPAQQQRMMGDDEIGTAFDGLGNHLRRRPR